MPLIFSTHRDVTMLFRITLLVLLVISVRANASGVLDQEYLGEDGDFSIAGFAAQTFTVGTTGVLSSVDLRLGRDAQVPDGTFAVTIGETQGGLPVQMPALGGLTVQRSDLPNPIQSDDYISLDFSSENIQVDAGERLAIIVGMGSLAGGLNWGLGNTVQTNGQPEGGYSGGQAFIPVTGNPFWRPIPRQLPVVGIDFNFRTFVRPIPEPFSLVLWSFVGVIGALCRSRQ